MKLNYLIGALIAFILAILAVRYTDGVRAEASRQNLNCPPGHVMLQDSARSQLCVPGSLPQKAR